MSIKNLALRGFVFLTVIIFSWNIASAQSQAEKIIESWLGSAQGYEFAKITHDGVSHDSATSITTVKNLSLAFDASNKLKPKSDGTPLPPSAQIKYTLTFPVIEFENLSADDTHYSASTINASQSILRFSISGTGESDSDMNGTYGDIQFNNLRWSKIPDIADDPTKPISKYFPLVAALLDISFDNATIGAMDMIQSIQKPTPTTINIHYGAMEIGKTERGNFSSLVMNGMEMELPNSAPDASPDSPLIKIKMGRVTAQDYNYGTFLDAFRPGTIAASDNEPFNTFLGDMVFEGMEMISNEATFTMGNIISKDIGIRAPKIDLLSEFDRLFLEAQEGGKEPDPKKLIELVANIYGTLRLGLFEMQNMQIDVPGKGNGGMGTFRIADLSANGMGEFLLKAINFNAGPKNKFNMDEFAYGDMTFPPLSALLNLEAAQKANDIVAMMKAIPTLGYFTMKGISGVIPDQGSVSLEEFTTKMANFIGPIPTKIEAIIKNAKIPVDQLDAKQRAPLQAMGFSEVDVSFNLNADWSETTNVLSLQSGMEIVDGGLLDASLAIGSIPRDVFENPLAAQGIVAFVTFDKANITFDDRSIVERGMTLAGAAQGLDAETMKAQALGILPIVLQKLEQPAFVNELVASVKTLLDTKGKITATATPPAPVLILQLMGAGASAPGAVIELLNVNVSAQ